MCVNGKVHKASAPSQQSLHTNSLLPWRSWLESNLYILHSPFVETQTCACSRGCSSLQRPGGVLLPPRDTCRRGRGSNWSSMPVERENSLFQPLCPPPIPPHPPTTSTHPTTLLVRCLHYCGALAAWICPDCFLKFSRLLLRGEDAA